jgi:hypothetical protein
VSPDSILKLCTNYVSTYQAKNTLAIVVAVADPEKIKIGISIQRSYPLTSIERSYGIPFGRFRSDASRLLSDPDELHGYKWNIETHEAVFAADAATEEHLKHGRRRRVPIELSTGLGNVLQNLRSLAYLDRASYMVVGERPDHPPPYACLVEYAGDRLGQVGVELLLFNELGGCQQVDKQEYFVTPVHATTNAKPKFEDQIRWAVSGYPLVINGVAVTLEMTTRSISDFRHVWRLPKLEKSLVQHLARISNVKDPHNTIEFYFGFDEIREKRNFVLVTRGEVITLPMELAMTEEWLETMCNVCSIEEEKLKSDRHCANHAFRFDPEELAEDFAKTDYVRRYTKDDVKREGDFYIDAHRNEVSVKLLPAIYPHHIVGVTSEGQVVNISICGLSGRSGITIDRAKELAIAAKLCDALVFDNGNDVVARIKGGDIIAHEENKRQTRLTAALHFASLLDPGPKGGFEVVSDTITVARSIHPSDGVSVQNTVEMNQIGSGEDLPSEWVGDGSEVELNGQL